MELFLFWLLFAVLTAVAANSRGRSWLGWGCLGFLFSFFALIVVLLMKPVADGHRFKKCNQCMSVVDVYASICKFCNSKLR